MGVERRPLGLLAALLLLLGVSTAASPRGAGSSADGEPYGELRAVLRRRSATDGRGGEQLVHDLVALGPGAIPELYALAVGRDLEVLVGASWEGAAWCCGPEEIPGLCARALGAAPSAAVLVQLARALEAGPALPERLTLLRLLGEQGSADGLELLVRMASELGALELSSPRGRAALLDASLAILRGDVRSFALLEHYLDAFEPSMRAVLVDAIGAAGRRRGMPVLERMLAEEPELEAEILTAMGELEDAHPWELTGRTMTHAARRLHAQDAAERALAARLVGAVHGLEAIPELIQLLNDDDAIVRRCAESSLQRIASVPLGSEAASWEAWLQREEGWREANWTRLSDALVAARPGPANEALRELTRHPLFRHEAALLIAESLVQQQRAVAVAACSELERLGSRWALPGLVKALENGQPQVRAAAWHALRHLTGEDLELSLELWRARIDF